MKAKWPKYWAYGSCIQLYKQTARNKFWYWFDGWQSSNVRKVSSLTSYHYRPITPAEAKRLMKGAK